MFLTCDPRNLLCVALAALGLRGAAATVDSHISGWTVDQEGRRYPGLVVTLERLTWASETSFASREIVGSMRTSHSGAFRFDNLPWGTYCVISRHDAWHHTGWEAPCYPHRHPYEVGVTRGFQGARGRVLDSAGRPVAGVLLEHTHVQDLTGHGLLRTVWASAETDASGEFFLAPLIDDYANVTEVTSPSGQRLTVWIEGREIAQAAAGDNTIRLPQSQPVTLRVVGRADSRGVPGVRLHLMAPEPGRAGDGQWGTTDASGEARFEPLGMGDWSIDAHVAARRSSVIPLQITAANSAGPHTLMLGGMGRVAGRVFGSNGRPLSNTRVIAYSLADLAAGVPSAEAEGSAVTAANGSYEINGLSHGFHRLFVEQWGNTLVTGTDTLDVEVPQWPEVQQDIEVNLSPPLTVGGSVTDESGATVAGVAVWLLGGEDSVRHVGTHLEEGGLLQPRNRMAMQLTSSSGAFRIPARAPAEQIQALWAQDRGGRVGLTVIELATAGTTRTPDVLNGPFWITLAPPATVEGTVRRGDSPVADLDMVAYPSTVTYGLSSRPGRRAIPTMGTSSRFLTHTVTDAGGHYRFMLPRGHQWTVRPLNDTEMAMGGEAQFDLTDLAASPVPQDVRMWDHGLTVLRVRVVHADTRQAIGRARLLIDPETHERRALTGDDGAPAALNLDWRARDGSQLRHTVVPDVPGHRFVAAEGVKGSLWGESVFADHPQRLGWTCEVAPGERAELTILVRPGTTAP